MYAGDNTRSDYIGTFSVADRTQHSLDASSRFILCFEHKIM